MEGSASNVLAARHEGTPFAPASSLQTLLHAHAMQQVRIGAVNLGLPMRNLLGRVRASTRVGSRGRSTSAGPSLLDASLRQYFPSRSNSEDEARLPGAGGSRPSATCR